MGEKRFRTARSRHRIAPMQSDGEVTDTTSDIINLYEELELRQQDDAEDPEARGLNELDRLRHMEAIKQMPKPLRIRRKVRDHMIEIGGNFKGSGLTAWKYKQNLKYEKWKKQRRIGWRNFMNAIELWGTTCNTIEGYAGSGVLSYFHMLRWVFKMNVLLFLLVFGFIIVPQLLFPSPDYKALDMTSADVESMANSTNTTAIVITCSSYYANNITKATSVIDNIFSFLYGSSWMENTVMFYGYYDTYDQRTEDYAYDSSAAYMAVNFAVYFASLLVIVRVASGGYAERLESSNAALKQYSTKIFASWDYNLTNEKNARNHHKSIWRELKVNLEEDKRKKHKHERTNCETCGSWTVRIIINLLIAASLAGAGYVIYLAAVQQARFLKDPAYSSWHTVVQFLVQFMTSLVISILNAILPMVYTLLIKLEKYGPAFEVNMTLFRTIFLKLASLTILIITIFSTITCKPQDVCGTGTDTCPAVKCWETYFGQEIYKLIIMDFIIVVVFTFLVETPRALLGKCCKGKLCQLIGQPTFDIPKNVLDLIYGQTLFWLGVYFSPMIPAIVVIKMFLVFYIKFFSTMINYKPSETPFRASDTQSFYVYVLFVDFLICLIPTFYVIWQIPPSRGCGPFRDLDYMYLTISDGVSAAPGWLNDVLDFLISPLVLVTIALVLFVGLWYSCSKINAYQKVGDLYKMQLAQQAQSRMALMKMVQGQGKPKKNSYLKNKSKQPVPGSTQGEPAGQDNLTMGKPACQEEVEILQHKVGPSQEEAVAIEGYNGSADRGAQTKEGEAAKVRLDEDVHMSEGGSHRGDTNREDRNDKGHDRDDRAREGMATGRIGHDRERLSSDWDMDVNEDRDNPALDMSDDEVLGSKDREEYHRGKYDPRNRNDYQKGRGDYNGDGEYYDRGRDDIHRDRDDNRRERDDYRGRNDYHRERDNYHRDRNEYHRDRDDYHRDRGHIPLDTMDSMQYDEDFEWPQREHRTNIHEYEDDFY